MFSTIVGALNELPESQRALQTVVDLARSCSAELATGSIQGDLPAYASFPIVVYPGAPATMMEQRLHCHEELHKEAANLARERAVHAQGSIVGGRDVRAILHLLKEQNADLLVLGRHQHDFYLSRLWSSAYDLAQDATCSVLGVH
jgi:nucleotide-binding universal stress UspA family protein